MADKFILGASTVDGVTFLKIRGVVDEDNTLAKSLRRIEGDTVVIDLEGVVRINSCGVRDWVNWLNDLESRGKRVVMARCSPCIVNQINLVNNFTGAGMVKSFFAPYYCGRCDREQLKLLQVESFSGMPAPHAPDCRGENCNEVQCEMEFDDIEQSYFAFLPRNTGRVVDDRLQKLIEGLTPDLKDRIARLDTVAEGETPQSTMTGGYSPLTATTGSISINRTPAEESRDVQPPAPRRKSSAGTALLAGAALALLGAIIAYVLFVVVGR
jgi:anti-anti-sigma regulatory factor